MTAAFSTAYSDAFDALASATGATVTVTHRNPDPSDTAPDGSWWVNRGAVPQTLWTRHTAGWVLFGQLHPNTAAVDNSPRLYMAAMMLCVRAYTLPNAALGVTGGYDMGAIYVGRISQDIAAMLQGFRGGPLPAAQRWPTLAEVKARLTITGSEMDVETQMALDAAIEQVSIYVTGSFGVGG